MPKQDQRDLLCFQELGYDSFGKSFTLRSTGGPKNYPCEVRFPGHTEALIEAMETTTELVCPISFWGPIWLA